LKVPTVKSDSSAGGWLWPRLPLAYGATRAAH
jgi:hypothetical protein